MVLFVGTRLDSVVFIRFNTSFCWKFLLEIGVVLWNLSLFLVCGLKGVVFQKFMLVVG